MINDSNQFFSKKNDKLKEWANALPNIDMIDSDNISMNAILVHFDANHIRIVLDNLLMSIATDDVIDIREIISDNNYIKYGIPVEIIIKVNSKLLEIGSSSIYNEIIFHRKPFALSCNLNSN